MLILINSPDSSISFQKAVALSKNEYLHFKLSNIEDVFCFFSSNFLFQKSKNIIIDDIYSAKDLTKKAMFLKLIQIWKNYSGQIFLLNERETKNLKQIINLEFDKIIDIPKINNKNINSFIKEKLILKKLKFNDEIVKYLSTILAYDYNVIETEIEKLSLLGKDRITKKDIEDVCFFSNHDSIFKIVDYYLSKQNDKAYNLLLFFTNSDTKNIEQLFSLFVSQIFKIRVYTYHYQKHGSIEKLLEDFKLNWFQIASFQNFITSQPILYLDHILKNLYKIDYEVKKNYFDRLQMFTLFILREYDN